MLLENKEPDGTPKESPDLFEEPRDHANQWDVSTLWQEETAKRVDPKAGLGSE